MKAEINDRVILETKGNVVFAGMYVQNLTINQNEGPVIMTDPRAQLHVWCPFESIQRLEVVRKGEEVPNAEHV